MSRKRREQLETLEGKGEVYEGDDPIADVYYALRISQTFIIIGSLAGDEEVPGRKDIRGQVTVTEGERNLIDKGTLTLELADGRRWKFFAASGDPVSAKYQVVNAGSEGLTE